MLKPWLKIFPAQTVCLRSTKKFHHLDAIMENYSKLLSKTLTSLTQEPYRKQELGTNSSVYLTHKLRGTGECTLQEINMAHVAYWKSQEYIWSMMNNFSMLCLFWKWKMSLAIYNHPRVIGWKKDGIYHKEKACDKSCSRRMFGPLFVLRHVDKGMRSTCDNWMTTLRLIPAEENSK